MLLHIDIKNFITITELSIEFSSGTTVVTGETGAGKSILISAIDLALGGRATPDIIRNGKEKADISLTFGFDDTSKIYFWLKENDLLETENECIVRRVIQKDGKTRCFINGIPQKVQTIKEFCQVLINLHGQHESQSLFNLSFQREMLDKFAGHTLLTENVFKYATEWQRIKNKIDELENQSADSETQRAFLQFQLNELHALKLQENEFNLIEIEHKQLANADNLIQNLQNAITYLSEDENQNVLSLMHSAQSFLSDVSDIDIKLKQFYDTLNSLHIQIAEITDELKDYLEKIDIDPKRLTYLETRIGELFSVARKYKIKPEELLIFQEKLTQDLSAKENCNEQLEKLKSELKNCEEIYFESAKKLSKSRKIFAKKLSTEITETIHELSMPNAIFKINIIEENKLFPSLHGLEKITFEATMNPGQALHPIAKVASGGELSRISLAIHVATATQHTTPCLIFDEVDTGISGGTAEIVGKLLNRLGQARQVICITHLPQVAAQGDFHLLVEKSQSKGETTTNIRALKDAEKIKELARLLGGIKITQKTLDHAKEMLEKA